MQSFVALAGTLLFSVLVAAQQPTTNFSSNDISALLTGAQAVSQTIRNNWCTSEHTLCSDLCSGSTTATGNDCDPNKLTFSCACSANNSAPGLQYYQTSLIWNICTNALGNCLENNANDLPAQNNCKTSYVCGTLNATNVIGSSASTSSAAASTAAATTGSSGGSSSASATPSSTGTAASSPSPSSKSSFAVKVGQEYGTGIMAIGMVTLGALFL